MLIGISLATFRGAFGTDSRENLIIVSIDSKLSNFSTPRSRLWVSSDVYW